MTDAYVMTNSPIEVEVGGRKLKLQKLQLEQIFSALEAQVISQRIAAGNQVAKGLEGDDKINYLRGMTKDLPTGKELQELAHDQMSTVKGVQRVVFLAAKENQPDIMPEDIVGLIKPENLDEFTSIVSYVCDIGVEEEDMEGRAEGNVSEETVEKAPESPTQV